MVHWKAIKHLKNLGLQVLNFPELHKFKLFKRANMNDFYINNFVRKIHPPDRSGIILDVGSGSQKYRRHLEKYFQYESCDIPDLFMAHFRDCQTYICSVENLIMPDNSYDVSFCMMVLEHVSDPKKAISELARVTKRDGLIYLSTNFLYPRHGKPQDYFRFTEEGLRVLASQANLKIQSIVPMGGYFSMQSQFLFEAPQYLRNKIILGNSYPSRDMNFNISRLPLIIACALPIVLLNLVFQVIAIAVQSLDLLDKTKRFTMGYIITLKK